MLSLIAFVSVVWLKDQLGQGVGRNWFEQEQDQRNIENEPNIVRDDIQLPHLNQENRNKDNQIQGESPSRRPMLPVYLQSQLDTLIEEQWKSRNVSRKDFMRIDIEKRRSLNFNSLEYRDLLISCRTIALEREHDLNIELDEEVSFKLETKFYFVCVYFRTGANGDSVVDIEFNPEKKRRETILVSKNAQFFID